MKVTTQTINGTKVTVKTGTYTEVQKEKEALKKHGFRVLAVVNCSDYEMSDNNTLSRVPTIILRVAR